MTESLNSRFELDSPFRRLARSLDALPNRFPPAEDESDLRLLAKIFTPPEADLAAGLLQEMETPVQISTRLGWDLREVSTLLKEMSRKGLVNLGKTPEGRLGFCLLPFVVGIYELQVSRMDAEMARLFEDYFHKAYGRTLNLQPQVHRVIPVGESVKHDLEVSPYESVTALLDHAHSWGVTDCICRKQKTLIGDPCGHPIDVCMVLSQTPDAFSGSASVRPVTRGEAQQTLQRAAEAGLVHCVSNNQRDLWYICNCCTCSCGVLRGMAEMGIANVVARSAFINRVDENQCTGCGLCLPACPFGALTLDGTARVVEVRCAGCGVCVQVCPQGALGLDHRADASEPPVSEADWGRIRSSSMHNF